MQNGATEGAPRGDGPSLKKEEDYFLEVLDVSGNTKFSTPSTAVRLRPRAARPIKSIRVRT